MDILRNIAALIIGIVCGAVVNMALVTVGTALVGGATIGADVALTFPQLVFPFLAHALGTLTGATVAYIIASSHKEWLAYGVAAAFFAGGVAASFLITAPIWFVAVDLILAYFPMAWLGIHMGQRIKSK